MAIRTRRQESPNGLTGAAMKVLEQYVYGACRFMVIPANKLLIDMSYQRITAPSMVTRIVSRFDVNKFEPLTVNLRPDGTYYVVDGGHRLAAALRLGLETLTCRVISIGVSEEPAYFVELNRQRRWMTPVQTFKAELRHGNPAAVEINFFLADRGIQVSSHRTPTTITCTSALHDIYANGGTVALSKAVDTALSAWPEGEPRRFAGQILRGIDLFLKDHPRADVERLAARLALVTATHLLSKASNRWHAWRSLGQGGSLLEATAEEIARVYQKRSGA